MYEYMYSNLFDPSAMTKRIPMLAYHPRQEL